MLSLLSFWSSVISSRAAGVPPLRASSLPAMRLFSAYGSRGGASTTRGLLISMGLLLPLGLLQPGAAVPTGDECTGESGPSVAAGAAAVAVSGAALLLDVAAVGVDRADNTRSGAAAGRGRARKVPKREAIVPPRGPTPGKRTLSAGAVPARPSVSALLPALLAGLGPATAATVGDGAPRRSANTGTEHFDSHAGASLSGK